MKTVRALAISQALRALAGELGFNRVGVCDASPIDRAAYVREWIGRGRHGEMGYLARNLDVRLDPGALLPGARSVIVTAMNYHQPVPESADGSPRGRVARYAWGRDYHRVVKRRLHAFTDRLRAEIAEPFEARACVDTAPVLERELAARAGLGWIGKNTLVLDSGLGSYFFLGVIVTTLEIAPDAPAVDHCGTCTRCLEACPTAAFPAPYRMDATRCISYLTIEHRGEIDASLAPQMGNWVFGCDVCQEVCPFNRGAPVTSEPDFAPRAPAAGLDLRDVLAWNDDEYATTLRGSAMKRARLPMLKRNAEIALQNLRPAQRADRRTDSTDE